MSKMIERVARAMCRCDYPHLREDDLDGYADQGDEGRRPVHKPRWQWYEAKARAAIEAMREMTPEMYEALSATGKMWREMDSREVYTTLIDGALK